METSEVSSRETDMGRLQCRLTADMKLDIKRIAVVRGERLRGTCLYLCKLALDNPNSPKKEYSGDLTEKCIIAVDRSFIEQAQSYRQLHALEKKTDFFFDALSRGIHVHISDRY